MKKKKILLLGGSAQQVIVISTAKQLGYETVLCDYLPDNPGQYVSDHFYLVSTTDREAVLEVAQKEQVDGVLAFASDPAAPTAAYVSEKMNLAGNPLQSVETLCNKDRFRKFLKENGFNTPNAYGFSSVKEAMDSAAEFSYPLIIKPVDSSGSKGATVLHSDEGLEKALNFAFSFSRSSRVIVEDFIDKKHPFLIGGDLFIKDGEIVLWGLLNCHRDGRVNALVPVGKSYPLQLSSEDTALIRSVLSDMVRKLNMKDGSMNVELIMDKNSRVWPIDVGPRAGGNMIPDLLSDMFGVDIPKMSVLAAMGEQFDCEVREPEGCYATHNVHSDHNGTYHGISFSEEIDKHIYRKCLYKKEGDAVEVFDNASKCLGIVFMKFDHSEEMMRILNDIYAHITLN